MAQIFPFPGYIAGGADMRSPEEIAADEREEKEKAEHEEELCNRMTCIYCIEDREIAEREAADDQGYYDSKGHWTK